MKKVAYLSMLIGALGLMACGGGSGDDDDDDTVQFDAMVVVVIDGGAGQADASTGPDGGGIPPECNVHSQTGCEAGQKCTFILDDAETGIGHTGCAANGTVEAGGECTSGAAAGDADNCAGGNFCFNGACLAICEVGGEACAEGSCAGINNVEFGACLASCDPLMQNCAEGEGCYMLSSGAVCASVVGNEGMGVGQGGACEYLNDCASFFGCFDDGMGGGSCLRYCGPRADCLDTDGVPNSCGCGTEGPDGPGSGAQCALDELCGGISGEEVVGVCVAATDYECDCTQTPICPPPM